MDLAVHQQTRPDSRASEYHGRIIVTGGGTGGHVFPNLPIILRLTRQGWQVSYLGAVEGIERQLVPEDEARFFPIVCGKFRRYWSLNNLPDCFRSLFGLAQAVILLRALRPAVVFSKGGYVAVPVSLAAWLCRVPLIVHESDISPGLANRLTARFAKTVCITFKETSKFFSRGIDRKLVLTGMPIRAEVTRGNGDRGRNLCGFTKARPVILIMGGSTGSSEINRVVEAALPELTLHFQIGHLTGQGKRTHVAENYPGYKQFEFTWTVPDLLAMANIVVSRAGASSICEILAAKKLNILVPLPTGVSRGEQIENAEYCRRLGVSHVISSGELSAGSLLQAIHYVFAESDRYLDALARVTMPDGTQKICELITEAAGLGSGGSPSTSSEDKRAALPLRRMVSAQQEVHKATPGE